jgi:hypothetical protein
MKTRNAAVADVPASFGRTRKRGHFLAAWDGGTIFTRSRYTTALENELGLNNHFQGFVRLGRHLVISGGDPHRPAAELYVVRMESRKVTQPFRSNLWKSTLPPDADRAVARIQVDTGLWHAGGIDATGDLLAVPLEGGTKKSRVVFYDFTDPEAPARIEGAVIERTVGSAGAVGLAQREDGRFVVAVCRADSPPRFDFYLSHTAELTDGFLGPTTVALPDTHKEVSYQCTQLVLQQDGALYLVGFENTSTVAPTTPGVDLAHLWRVTVAWPAVTMEQVTWRQYTCRDRQANMDAGAGAWVDAEGDLHVYAVYHWRQDNVIRFSEFRAQKPAGTPDVVEPARGWIDLFEDKEYGGHCLSLLGRAGNDFRSYEHVHVEGAHFNDKVSSVRFQLPAGSVYRLYQDSEYAGPHFDLSGTGRVVEIPDLGLAPGGPGDRVSSSRWMESVDA